MKNALQKCMKNIREQQQKVNRLGSNQRRQARNRVVRNKFRMAECYNHN